MVASTNCGVYEIVNAVNGKRYVGSSVKVAARMRKHAALLGRGTHHSPILQRAWLKHGADAFVFRQIIVCAPADLIMYEQIVMDVCLPAYNVLPRAGSSLGRVMSDEHKKRIGDANRGRPTVITPEQRLKISLALKGRTKPPRTAEHRARMSTAKRGRPLGTPSESTRLAISHALRGRTLSAEHVAKMSAARTGVKQTAEHIANAAAARTGKKRGPYKKRAIEPQSAGGAL
jgi:group I intron endonuclease